ncbi:hypothetical protein [Priestia taiwanensis]|uniref:Uncharacterized protein n=1 Tax=Priestia taiwanensis TaxID=1347902 RepID=A0A917ELU1_9BACI|nr:hypothetical protein [Priestia taiwanensis]MBM7362111.1 hypothetical protein [Priestia taiwanensis]GGE59569.1 hypothetical protein GCM10007140_07350 [Priestia taiwanensis]
MRKIVIAISLLAVICIGGYVFLNSAPPLPTVSVDGNRLEVRQGSYCWDGPINSRCVDSMAPPELMKHYDIQPVIVSPKSEVNIAFHSEPYESGGSVWFANGQTGNATIRDGVLVLPEEKGVYVYSVHGQWQKGSASYAFVVEVR